MHDLIAGLLTLATLELLLRPRLRLLGCGVGLFSQLFWLALIWNRALWGLLPLTLIMSWRYAAWLKHAWYEDEEFL